jgi:hypothetical protein
MAARASQNVAAMAALLDTLLVPSTDKVVKVYQLLKNILGTATAQQAESSFQHQIEPSVLTLDCSKVRGGQRAAQEAPEVGIASSLTRLLTHNRLAHPGAQSAPQVRRQHHMGDDDVQSQCHAWNLCRRGQDDHEGRSLSPEGPGLKAFRSIVHDAHFPKCF